MEERAIKRLLIMVAVSIVIIFVFKSVMSKTVANLNLVAAEKKQAAAKPPAEQEAETPPYDAAIVPETPAALPVAEAATLEQPSASGVNEVRPTE